MFNRFKAWVHKITAPAEVIPDNVYQSCWVDSPVKEQIEGVSTDDRGNAAPVCVATSQLM